MRLVISYPEMDSMIKFYCFEYPKELRYDFRVGHEHEKNVDFWQFREHLTFTSKLIL